jgi:hypothetical protein
VALMEDRCRTCGRDPDLRLLELGAPERRPPSGAARRRAGNWRRRAPVIAVFALLWGFLAFAGGSDDEGIPIEDAEDTTTTTTEAEDEDERRTTTSRRGPTTTTTRVIPGAPLLGEPTGLELVLVGVSGQVVDLDTGRLTRLRTSALGATQRGILVDDGGDLATWPAPYDGSNGTTLLPATPGTLVDQMWVVGDGTMVWAVRRSDRSSETRPDPEAVLVDLDGRVVGRFRIPPEVWPVGATDHGLVVDGASGVYLLDATGDVERISTGDVIGVVGDRVYATSCDEELRCQTEVLDGRGRLVESIPPPTDNIGWATAAHDGRLAYVVYDDEFGVQLRVEIDGATVFEGIDGVLGGGPGVLAWSPDGRWLAIASFDGVHFLDTLGDAGELVVDPGVVDQTGAMFFLAPGG